MQGATRTEKTAGPDVATNIQPAEKRHEEKRGRRSMDSPAIVRLGLRYTDDDGIITFANPLVVSLVNLIVPGRHVNDLGGLVGNVDGAFVG